LRLHPGGQGKSGGARVGLCAGSGACKGGGEGEWKGKGTEFLGSGTSIGNGVESFDALPFNPGPSFLAAWGTLRKMGLSVPWHGSLNVGPRVVDMKRRNPSLKQKVTHRLQIHEKSRDWYILCGRGQT